MDHTSTPKEKDRKDSTHDQAGSSQPPGTGLRSHDRTVRPAGTNSRVMDGRRIPQTVLATLAVTAASSMATSQTRLRSRRCIKRILSSSGD